MKTSKVLNLTHLLIQLWSRTLRENGGGWWFQFPLAAKGNTVYADVNALDYLVWIIKLLIIVNYTGLLKI